MGATPDCLPLLTLPASSRPRCIPNSFGSHLTPSVVTFLEDGEVAVGRAARRMAVSHPATTYGSAKRVIGRSFLDPVVQQELGRLPYRVRGGRVLGRWEGRLLWPAGWLLQNVLQLQRKGLRCTEGG